MNETEVTNLGETEPRRRGTVATALSGSHTDDMGVDGARDAVMLLDVQFGNGVF